MKYYMPIFRPIVGLQVVTLQVTFPCKRDSNKKGNPDNHSTNDSRIREFDPSTEQEVKLQLRLNCICQREAHSIDLP